MTDVGKKGNRLSTFIYRETTAVGRHCLYLRLEKKRVLNPRNAQPREGGKKTDTLVGVAKTR